MRSDPNHSYQRTAPRHVGIADDLSDTLRTWICEAREEGRRDAEWEHAHDYHDGFQAGMQIGLKAGRREGRCVGHRTGVTRALIAVAALVMVACAMAGRRS